MKTFSWQPGVHGDTVSITTGKGDRSADDVQVSAGSINDDTDRLKEQLVLLIFLGVTVQALEVM